MYGGPSPCGTPYRAPPNQYLTGNTLVIISFIQLILGIVLLVAQVGLYYYCSWANVCLVIPTFVACVLYIITSIVGIATGVEKTNGMILTLLVMSIIVLIVTPINMGMWGLTSAEGGIPLKFSLVPSVTLGVGDTLAAIYWGLIFLPLIQWILFIVVTSMCAFALCCPGYGRYGGPYGVKPCMGGGYGPGYGGPPPMAIGPPARPARAYQYY